MEEDITHLVRTPVELPSFRRRSRLCVRDKPLPWPQRQSNPVIRDIQDCKMSLQPVPGTLHPLLSRHRASPLPGFITGGPSMRGCHTRRTSMCTAFFALGRSGRSSACFPAGPTGPSRSRRRSRPSRPRTAAATRTPPSRPPRWPGRFPRPAGPTPRRRSATGPSAPRSSRRARR